MKCVVSFKVEDISNPTSGDDKRGNTVHLDEKSLSRLIFLSGTLCTGDVQSVTDVHFFCFFSTIHLFTHTFNH